MQMTPGEIIANYRQSKNKTEQIKILADLNACATDKIINTIVENSNGEYKLSYFNKLNHKLKNQKKNEQEKVEYKKPEIITEKKAVELEKSAAEEAAKKAGESLKQIVDKVPAILTDNEIIKPLEWVPEISLEEYGKMYDEDRKIYDSPASVGKMTCNICKHYNGIENRCLKTKKIRTPIHICDVEETERLKYSSGIESLDNAIEIVHAEIERIDKEIAELRALRADIIAACQGGVPF